MHRPLKTLAHMTNLPFWFAQTHFSTKLRSVDFVDKIHETILEDNCLDDELVRNISLGNVKSTLGLTVVNFYPDKLMSSVFRGRVAPHGVPAMELTFRAFPFVHSLSCIQCLINMHSRCHFDFQFYLLPRQSPHKILLM